MKPKLYTCQSYRKGVNFISNLTKHVNAYKIEITLPNCKLLNLAPILEYNTTKYPDFPSDNNRENIRPKALNNSKEKIRPADINNN